jgi:hypothetical protein
VAGTRRAASRLAYLFVWTENKFMRMSSDTFKQNATAAMADAGLPQALAKTKPLFVKKRGRAPLPKASRW